MGLKKISQLHRNTATTNEFVRVRPAYKKSSHLGASPLEAAHRGLYTANCSGYPVQAFDGLDPLLGSGVS